MTEQTIAELEVKLREELEMLQHYEKKLKLTNYNVIEIKEMLNALKGIVK